MKSKFLFVAISVIAVCTAFVNSSKQFANKKYRWASTVNLGGGVLKYYVSTDITGQVQGTQYLCNGFSNICTVEDEQAQFQIDGNGRYVLSTANPNIVVGDFSIPTP